MLDALSAGTGLEMRSGGQFAAPNDDTRLRHSHCAPIQFALLFSQKTAVAGFMR